MHRKIDLTLGADEIGIVIEALQTDFESYVDAAEAARERDHQVEARSLAEASKRVAAVLEKVQAARAASPPAGLAAMRSRA